MQVWTVPTCLVLLAFHLLDFVVQSIPIDNEVVGSSVQCTAETITVNFETRNDFTGRIFIKGMVENAECVDSFETSRTRSPSKSFTFGVCNMQRARTLTPARGMMQSIVVVISFHSIFLTKVDRAFKVQCFYMEAEKAVTSNLEVSMLTTDSLRDAAAMPTCTYTVRQGSRDGPAVRFARIGQPVYHLWECNSAAHNLLVKSCYVDDGQGNRYEILDDEGCALDRVIMSNLNYELNENARAWVEAHVFKFADRPNVFFQCVVQICNRGEAECDAITPPRCTRRNRREVNSRMRTRNETSVTASLTGQRLEMDLLTNTIKVLDIEDSLTSRPETQTNVADATIDQSIHQYRTPYSTVSTENATVCMSPASFGALMAMIVLVLFVAAIVAIVVAAGRIKHDNGDKTCNS